MPQAERIPDMAARRPRDFGNGASRDRLIEVATQVFVEVGFDAATMDEVARRAGTSRATLYRRYGSREALFIDAVRARAATYFAASRVFDTHRGLVADLERSNVIGVIEMPADPLLQIFYNQGGNAARLALEDPTFRAAIDDAVRPRLVRWRDRGELRAELDFDEITEWMVHQQFSLIARGPWTEAELQHYTRRFMVPVLMADPPERAAGPSNADLMNRLEEMESRLK